jgi:hypothetical protein
MERKPTGSTRFSCVARQRIRLARWLLFFLLLALPAGAREQPPAAGPRLQIASVDRSGYPTIGLNLIATNAASEPRTEFSGLRLWENGVPIADYTLEQATVGLELTILLDVAPDWAEGDAGSSPPLVAVEESLLRLAGRFLEAGRDTFWLAAPGGRGARWLLQEVADPGQLAAAAGAIEARAAASDDPAALLSLALERATQQTEQSGHFAAIVLYSQGTGFSATRLQALSAEAQALQLPIFVVLTSPVREESILASLEWLTLPTRGAIAELADTQAVEGLYALLAANATQTQLRYLSNATGSEVPVRVALGNLQASSLLDLSLQPPSVEIALAEDTTIRRVGITLESELSELQPAVQTVPVSLSWPDGVPRRVQSATLLVDGAAQVAPVSGGADALAFEWDISLLDEGAYALTAEVTDSAGLSAASSPRTVSITVARPAPAPTEVLPTAPRPAAPATRPLSPGLIGLGAGLFILLGLLLLWRARQRVASPRRQRLALAGGNAYIELESGERCAVMGDVTIGRGDVDVSVAGEGVALLHARLSVEEAGYWLYDEGSSGGTLVNGERLGLAGRPLADGDHLQFGEVAARFVLER